jgi:hypothetical protein
LLLLTLAPLACAGPGAPARLGSGLVAVHVDTLIPERAAAFEAARKEWIGELEKAATTDHRGRFFEGQGRFLTLRPLARFADLDATSERRAQALTSVPKEASARYDQGSDTALAFPHTSEIWRSDDSLGYRPPEGALEIEDAGAIRMVTEDVRPDSASEDAHAAAWERAKAALSAQRYPLTRIAFRSVFGRGSIISFWLAPSAAALDAAPLPEAAVAPFSDVVLRRQSEALRPRPDLSSP